ncbi:MAG TPA: ubiquinol-cytochrome c reductase iron-sulfur subunit [archaeon]|nr:ubiquinol-cytochrome c reductase iron-sulfur subunit [archaeon]
MSQSSRKGRRNFLNLFLGGSSLAFLAAIFYPAIKFLNPPEVEDSNTEAISAGKVEDFKKGSGKVVKFGSKPALVIRDDSSEFKAFLAVCTHLQCTVQYLPDEKVIWCACHNGKYDLNGINISGPPPRPLTPLKVNIQQDEIFISREA